MLAQFKLGSIVITITIAENVKEAIVDKIKEGISPHIDSLPDEIDTVEGDCHITKSGNRMNIEMTGIQF